MAPKLIDIARTFLGISAYTPQTPPPWVPDEATAQRMRELTGGQLQPVLQTNTRWYLADLEAAAYAADSGNLQLIGQLCRAMRRDGMISGLMSTRTSGLVALPRRFNGYERAVQDLTDESRSRTLFDEMFPPSELALLASDGIGCGVGIAELVPVKGRPHPVMVRLEPEFLQYRWNESRWYYQSVVGSLPITPGDGRWILHTPGGTLNPWTYGSWYALGDAFITKSHAKLHRANYSSKLANPARVAVAPAAATEDQRLGFLASLMRWGLNTVFALPVGWDAKLLESNGRGIEVFKDEIESANLEIMIELAGQVVTVTGGTGFANADIHQTIRADLIKQTGLALAHTINTQGIPPWQFKAYGPESLADCARVKWHTDPPEDLDTSAKATEAFGKGVDAANAALRPYDLQVDAVSLAARHGLPTIPINKAGTDKTPPLQLAPTDVAKVVKVDEARESQGLEPIGDERGDQTIQELTDAADVEKTEIQADTTEKVAAAKPTPKEPNANP